MKSKKISKLTCWLFIFFFSFGLFITSSQAAVFLRKNNDGTKYYKCSSGKGIVGTVRVYTLGKNLFRVFGIRYSGEIKTKAAVNAAAHACGEISKKKPKS